MSPARTLAASAMVIVTIASCSGGPSGASTVPSAPPASAVSSASPAAASPAAASPSSAPNPSPSPSPAIADDLTTVIPPELGGLPVDARRLTPDQVGKHFDGGLRAIADSYLKVDLATLDVVVGWGGASGGDPIVTAIRVPGKDSSDLEKAFETGVSPMSIIGGTKATPASVGGKDVLVIGTTYMYVTGNVAFVVQTGDRAIADEALAYLP